MLNDKYAPDGPERVGFILQDDTIIEVENIHDDPENGFRVSGADLARYSEQAKATWHTHPDHSKNLSVEDYHAFLLWPDLRHFIVGKNGTAEYFVEKGEVHVA